MIILLYAVDSMLCSNATGRFKFLSLRLLEMLGSRVHSRKSGLEMGYDYPANSMSWMNGAIFVDWLRNFYNFVTKILDRKILVLINNNRYVALPPST